MAVAFRRIDYAGLSGQPSFCDVAVVRWAFGATVLLEDREDNLGTIVGHYVEGLATRLWREVLYDLDASTIRWFERRGSQVSEVTFAVVPDSRSGFLRDAGVEIDGAGGLVRAKSLDGG
jgi:hypothetical protein